MEMLPFPHETRIEQFPVETTLQSHGTWGVRTNGGSVVDVVDDVVLGLVLVVGEEVEDDVVLVVLLVVVGLVDDVVVVDEDEVDDVVELVDNAAAARPDTPGTMRLQ